MTTSYIYDGTQVDRLASFGGKAITYDANGCVKTYDGWTYTWTKGKLTKRVRGTRLLGIDTYTYTYDAYGRRTSKNYSFMKGTQALAAYMTSSSTNYTYDASGRLIREQYTEIFNDLSSNSREIIYLYDESGVIGVMYSYNGSTSAAYFYRRNLQGDVTAIYNREGNRVGEYAYDAWGNCTILYGASNDLVNNNPIRYRGYYFDSETGCYYLSARYYNPQWRRFISPDSTDYLDPESVNGLNLYAYCGNDPVNYADPSGHAPEWLTNLLTGVSIVVGTALFVTAIIASAGAVGALVGVGAAAIGLSTTAVSTAVTIATASTCFVAFGVGLFGASNAVEVFSGGINPIRDYAMGGNQMAYNIANGFLNAIGTIAVAAGMVAPKVLQKIAQYGGTPRVSNGKTVGYVRDFFDKNENWSFRIDATTHGNPNSNSYHHNPHFHVLIRGGDGTAVYYLWEIIKELLK